MKAENYYITDHKVVDRVVQRVLDIKPEDKLKVTISNEGTKSAKQRGLQWIWYEDISKAGIGGKHEDCKSGVHLVCKFRYAVPIMQREDEFFAALYRGWLSKHKGDETAILWFVDNHVSTEDFTVSQMAEYLTDMQRYYLSKGVNLTAPQFRGLLN